MSLEELEEAGFIGEKADLLHDLFNDMYMDGRLPKEVMEKETARRKHRVWYNTCAELEHLISDLWQCIGHPHCGQCEHHREDSDEGVDKCKLNLYFRYKRALNWRKRVPNA